MSNKEPEDASQVLGQRVAELRKKRHWTLDQMAAISGVSRSMLSQIERNQANPTLAVTLRIAHAFDLTIGELIEQPWTASSIELVPHDDPNSLYRADGECQLRTLSPLHREKSVEFYELRLAPNAALDSAPHFEGTKELLTVVAGQAEVTSGNSRHKLTTGDSAYYRADLAHCIRSIGNTELHCYLVVRNP